jgi:hypothetical protein
VMDTLRLLLFEAIAAKFLRRPNFKRRSDVSSNFKQSE